MKYQTQTLNVKYNTNYIKIFIIRYQDLDLGLRRVPYLLYVFGYSSVDVLRLFFYSIDDLLDCLRSIIVLSFSIFDTIVVRNDMIVDLFNWIYLIVLVQIIL